MALVRFPGTLTPFTGGVEQVTLDAPRVLELLGQLVALYPGLEGQLGSLAVAVDGQVHPDAEYEPLLPTSEVDFVPRMAGG